MLCQLSYEVKSGFERGDISELNLVPSPVSISIYDNDFYGVMHSGVEYVCGITLSVYPHRASWKICQTNRGIQCIFKFVQKTVKCHA